MKKHLPVSFFLLILILLTACQTQSPTDLPTASVSEPQTPAATPLQATGPDGDPSFMKDTAVITSYGPHNITRNIIQDRNGNLWFASWEGIIRYDGKSFTNFTNKAGLRRFHVFAVFEDESGNIWFGTIGAGVYKYDGRSFRNFTTQDGLATNTVLCIAADNSGQLWFGTKSGVSCYNGASFRTFTKKDGLIDDDVSCIMADKMGKVWFGTSGGVCFYDGMAFTEFKNQAGQTFNKVSSMIEDKNGNLWLGGQDGLCRYDGQAFTQFITKPAGTLLEDKKGNIWLSAWEAATNMMMLYRYDGKSSAGFSQVIKKERQIFCVTEDRQGHIWLGTEKGACRYDGKSFNWFTGK